MHYFAVSRKQHSGCVNKISNDFLKLPLMQQIQKNPYLSKDHISLCLKLGDLGNNICVYFLRSSKISRGEGSKGLGQMHLSFFKLLNGVGFSFCLHRWGFFDNLTFIHTEKRLHNICGLVMMLVMI